VLLGLLDQFHVGSLQLEQGQVQIGNFLLGLEDDFVQLQRHLEAETSVLNLFV